MKAMLLILLLALALSCTGPKEKWIDVTPDADVQGWTVVNIPPDQPLSETKQWSVSEDGTVRCSGAGGHEWLRYDGRQFANCVFHVEWRFEKLEKPAKYNSGIYVRNNADGTIWHQLQIGDSSGGYLFGKTPVNGKIVRLTLRDQMQSNPVKAAGEWNSADITCRGNAISAIVNGVTTVEWTDLEVESGYIGLEAEGYAVEFRNLRVKTL